MSTIAAVVTGWLEYLEGASGKAPALFRGRAGWLATAAWWVLLLCLIAAFSGQSSKFIYVDF